MSALAVVQPPRSVRPRRRQLARQVLPSARTDRLYFAQVREDARVEIEALRPTARDHIVVVGSGGCTALSLLAAGAGRVVSVDLNSAQNHLVELKANAVARLPVGQATLFLGGAPGDERNRWALYTILRRDLSPDARAYWDAREAAVRRGVINAGVSERFIGLIVGTLRRLIHPAERCERLLRCRTLEEQRAFYDQHWNTRRWRLLFRLLLNQRVFSRAYDPAFFAQLEKPSFAEHFLRRVEHTLTELPVADNPFLHQMLTGHYAVSQPDGVPYYLSEPGAQAIRANAAGISLVDGSYTEYLRRCKANSIDAFVLSNICEWLTPVEVYELFAEVVRTAAPGARVCFRNFVGWTEVPERWREVVVEDRARGEALMRDDRSLVQRRFAICRVRKAAR